MSVIYLCTGLFAVLFILMYYSSIIPAISKIPSASKIPVSAVSAQHKKNLYLFVLLIIAALALRFGVAYSVDGHTTDISCFKGWATMAYEGGLQNFYASETFTDYPPGYMYVLWLIGAVKSVFNIARESAVYTALIKSPAIICDILTGIFIYKLLEKRTNSVLAANLSFLYLINPAVVVNSSAWGQVDSVFTLFVVLFIYCVCEKKILPACIFYTVGFIIKPQTIIFTPVLLLFLYKALFAEKDDGAKNLKQFALSVGVCAMILILLILPFTRNFDFRPVIEQYISTLASYPYASVNAFNMFALFGGIWRDANEPFLLLSYSVWSYIFIIGIVLSCVYIYIKQKGETNMFLLGAFIITAMFTLAAKMHERYVFPALALLICAFAYQKDKRILLSFCMLSIGQFLNTAAMLYENIERGSTAPPDGAFVPIVCLINIATFIYLAYITFGSKAHAASETTADIKPNSFSKNKKPAVSKPRKAFSIMRSADKAKLTRADAIIMIAVTLVYSAVAFVNLGDMKAPYTKWDSMYEGDGFYAEFSPAVQIDSIRWFTGSYEERNVSVTITDENGLQSSDTISLGSVFCWHDYAVNASVSSVKVETTQYDTSIMEIAFISGGEKLNPTSLTPIGNDCGTDALMDEQDAVVPYFSYMNGTYFDEIYHARTAYEFINGLTPYENTHPPLGKLFIALGVLIFGMNPFGWRIIGTLFGIAMLPCIYLFAKKMFKSTPVSFAVIVLFASDFMHFTQTRIATIDVYITFFIILMYYFMYDYTKKSFYDTPFKKTLIPLALSGLCMGLGIASKWTGIYAGLGLAVIFFITLGRRIYEYKKVMSDRNSPKELICAVAPCKKYCTLTLLWCIVFFIIMPALIYVLSYIPYLRAPGMEGFKSIIDNQTSMFSYHSRLTDSHPFSSFWYEWPIIARPIWYYSADVSDTVKMSISSFGNPFVWWLGIGAFVWCIYKFLRCSSKTALFLIIGYLAQYLPWVGVTRVVFIYHYFTCVPFVVLMLGYVVNDIFAKNPYKGLTLHENGAAVGVFAYCALCVLAFAAFYPVLSGFAADVSYLTSLQWFDSWIFTAGA